MNESIQEKPKRGRPPTGRERLSIVLTIKGRAEWREWLDARALEEGVLPTELIDKSLAYLAKSKKWGEVPSRI